MNFYWCISIIIFLLLYVIILQPKKKSNLANTTNATSDAASETGNPIYPYEKKLLLTKAEYAFYKILKEKCDNRNLIICPKVRMEDFVKVTDKKNTLKYRGYIKSRHIDFLLCNSKLYILAGIELDDNSHQKSEVQKVDEFKNEVFKKIGLPLYRVKMSKGNYNEQIEIILNEIIF